jgi:nucleotide-binding universal stress UspA family protein
MIRSLLVGLDGSDDSTAATELGIRWARRFDALLVGLGIVDEPTIRGPETVLEEETLASARRRAEEFLQRFALRCVDAEVSHKILEDVGTPEKQIFTEAQRYDLILLGQKSHFRFATQDSPDDTLVNVLKNSPRPVVTVPNALNTSGSVVVAYDGSLQAARALQAFEASGLGQAAEVHIVSVGDDHLEARRHAERAVEFLGFHEIKADPHVVSPTGGTAETILNQAAHFRAGLLVMGCYGRSALREFLLGSVTRTVLKRSPVPLFLSH